MQVKKLAGHVGAELGGIDLATLSDAGFEDLRAALFAHGVVAIRDQALSEDAHIALAERFGEIDVNRFFTPVASHPQIAEVRTKPGMSAVIGGTWHTDHSYDPAPAMCSILVARDLPPYGGDTLFASMAAACTALSPGLRATLATMSAWHSDGSFADSKLGLNKDASAFRAPSLHPVIIAHPTTGTSTLYVNGDFTTHFDGWTAQESAPLLGYLYQFCTQPPLTCRISYAPGTVVIWDNRLVQHFASADYLGHDRLMHRITVKGVPLSAAD
ncbi:MAG: TauD/TfdA dioxygenase family protein [Sedimentitalea sp.]